jgi:hypothetical protein
MCDDKLDKIQQIFMTVAIGGLVVLLWIIVGLTIFKVFL